MSSQKIKSIIPKILATYLLGSSMPPKPLTNPFKIRTPSLRKDRPPNFFSFLSDVKQLNSKDLLTDPEVIKTEWVSAITSLSHIDHKSKEREIGKAFSSEGTAATQRIVDASLERLRASQSSQLGRKKVSDINIPKVKGVRYLSHEIFLHKLKKLNKRDDVSKEEGLLAVEEYIRVRMVGSHGKTPNPEEARNLHRLKHEADKHWNKHS